jgi:Polyketide cyclase / dehydrase and lipid transport
MSEKRKLLPMIAGGVGIVILGVLGFAGTRPDTFRYERSTTIKAPPDKIVSLITNFHRWNEWSPWDKRDPALKGTYSGPESGKGAIYEWDGNKDVGTGRMEVIDVVGSSKVVIKLDFLKPFEGHNTAEFTIEPTGPMRDEGRAGAETKVTWVMHGPSPFMSKVVGLFMNMEALIGKDFETGLAQMKAIAEK